MTMQMHPELDIDAIAVSTEIERDFARDVWCVLGLPFDAVTLCATLDEITKLATAPKLSVLCTSNLNFVVNARRKKAFRESVIDSDLNVADGMPIIWAAKLIGVPLPERVTGADILDRLTRDPKSQSSPIKVFFFGGEGDVAHEASQAMNEVDGRAVCVGAFNPGFVPVAEMSDPETLETINSASPDFVILSLGAEKAQQWIEANRGALNARLVSHLGAALGFSSGNLQRAPRVFQLLGMEWAWRIKEEPQLWRRYWSDGLMFLRILSTELMLIAASRLSRKFRSNRSQTEAQVILKPRDRGLDVKLAGDFTSSQLGVVRDGFSKAAMVAGGGRGEVRVDFAAVNSVDSAFLGQLLLLWKHCRRMDVEFSGVAASPKLYRTMSRYGLGFLIKGNQN